MRHKPLSFTPAIRSSIVMVLICLLMSLRIGAQNSIVVENQLPGNPASEWDVSGAGDPTIQGFATDISVNRGQTVHFKISTDANAYSIKIYRLGYYQGNGGRFVGNGIITASLPQTQPAYLYETSTGLIDCGNWNESAHWDVPVGAVSGFYIARLERTDNGGASHIVFIVRDDASISDLYFQASDATWQAYNVYGGNSLYVGSTSYPSGHATKVSYNRPFVTRDGGGGGGPEEDWLFNAEYPMIRWLERNGYDVSYTTCVDADRYGSLILNHKIFLSVGHDEYWSAQQRTNVETARNNGVHLAFFSGNEIYWKTRWENSIDVSAAPYRTLVCYKEGDLGENVCGTKCDPLPTIWTGLWRNGCDYPGADGCNPENALSGQISWDGTTGAIEVPDTYKNLRFWRNTSVATLPTGQTATFSAGTLGYEWDWEQYTSSYPAGRIRMSETTQNSHTHHLSLYRHSSGALVFGAGTVQWSWGLDGIHDRGGSVEDIRMQQATVNLFADMDVQPGSLQPGLVPAVMSTDIQAPVSTITSPPNGDTLTYGVAVAITGTANDNVLVAGVEVSTDGGATWHVASGATNWTYSWVPLTPGNVNIKSRAFDDSGNIENPGIGITDSVTPATATTCPCTVFNPADVPAVQLSNDGQPIEIGMKFQSSAPGFITAIRFYKGVGSTGTHIGHLWSSTGVLLAAETFVSETSSGWQEVTLGSPVSIAANTTYVVSCHSGSGDYPYTDNYFTVPITNGSLRGLADGEDGPNGVYSYGSVSVFPVATYQKSNYWVDVVFADSIGPDTIPPVVNTTYPVNAASNVAVGTVITVTFSERLDPSTINALTFELRDNLNALVPVTVAYTSATHTVSLTPVAPLLYATNYSVTAKGGLSYNRIKDVAGNAMIADHVWSFTTAPAPPPVPTQGPGGPILLISSSLNPYSLYPVEILRAEGFNEFTAMDIAAVNATVLAQYDVVILGEIDLSPTDASMLTNWTVAGGTLIAFRPDTLLSSLMGITPTGGTMADKYMLVNTSSGPGVGIAGQTMQFHGTADLYSLSGATAVATLYSDATTATAYPAVTLKNVGSNGGQAIAFTYDLARSVVYTRQGNPAWAGQERDAQPGPIRANDQFYPDWIDLNKVAVPQADEQMHLLSNIIVIGNMDRQPLPRYWFLPKEWKAAIVMTGDDHGDAGMQPRFDTDIAMSSSGCSPADWECVRSTGYLYPGSTFTDSMARHYDSLGFEVALHVNTGCSNYNASQYGSMIQSQQGVFQSTFPSIPMSSTNRNHCIAWSDWSITPEVEAANGIRFDVNYYYWPGVWVNDRPGMFTGSGMPMRFTKADGSLIDCYQAPTQMTDESGISLPAFCDSLLNRANGPEGYYGVFVTNMHFDQANHPGANAIVASAQAHGVPVVSAKQMLDWVDARNSSSFSSMVWNNNVLDFTVNADTNALNMRAMIPVNVNGNVLISVTRNGSPVVYIQEVIKGIEYAFIPAEDGNYQAIYSLNPPLLISNVSAAPNANGTAIITWSTNVGADSKVDFDTSAALTQTSFAGAFTTNHSITLSGLISGETYYYRVTSEDGSDSVTAPALPAPPLTFTIPLSWCAIDETDVDFSGGTDSGTVVTSMNDGEVILESVISEEFNGTSVPAGWTEEIWDSQPGAVTTYNGQQVSVNGTHLYTNTAYGVGNSIEFAATFTSGNFQNVGFTADPAFNAPWVVIGQGISNGNVSARTSNNEVVSLGSGLLNAEHIYRIVRSATGSFSFYVDGVLIPTPGIALTTTANLHVQISDYPTGGAALSVNWLHITPYETIGTFTSRVFDSGDTTLWNNSTWTEIVPVGTGISVYARGGNTAIPDGGWTAFLPLTNGGAMNITARYLQYKAVLTTSDGNVTPVLEDIRFGCGSVIPCNSPAAYFSVVDSVLCQGEVIQLQLDSATGQSPYTLVVNGTTYTNVVPGQIFTTIISAPASLWGTSGAPANPNGNDGLPIEVGVKFRSSIDGFVNGVRFYKGIGNPGVRTGHLWASDGSLLATGTYNSDSTAGWDEILFTTPVHITANLTYIASYYSADGWFAITPNYFASGSYVNGDLTALQSGTDGVNGVYVYGGGFPTGGNTANYWADVLFTRAQSDTVLTYVLSSITDNGGCVNTGDSLCVASALISALPSGSISASPTCSGQDVYLTYSSETGNGPFDVVVNNTTYYNVVSGVPFNSGVNASSGVEQSIWDSTVVPATITASDNNAITLGVKFRSDTAGKITGIRFYKGPMNTGVHTGSLWSSTGVLLATGIFTNETATGWQELTFSTPVTIAANTTYIASYHTTTGNYSFNSAYFTASGVTNGHLTALQNGADGSNGVYLYGPVEAFPVNSFNSGNYWVDVVFAESDNMFSLTSVTNASGCSAVNFSSPVSPAQLIPMSLTESHVNIGCFGDTNGVAIVHVTDGSGAFTFLWNDPLAQVSDTAFGLAAGTYTVRVVDQNGCNDTAWATIIITEPSQALSISSVVVPVQCNGGADGGANSTANGGTTPYQYYWSTGDTVDVIANLLAGNYWVTVTDNNGCTSSDTIQVTQPALVTYSQVLTICAGDSVNVGLHSYNTGGLFVDTLTNISGCDSVVTTNLTVTPSAVAAQSVTLCFGEVLTVGSHTYTGNGIYTDTLSALSGCDSIVTTNLTVRPLGSSSQAVSICNGDSFTVGLHSYSVSGTYVDTLVTVAGCDTIISTALSVIPAVTNAQFITVCNGGNVTVGTHTYSASGVYSDTLTALNGCDSIVTTDLTVRLPVVITQSISICFGDTYTVGSHTYNSGGIYRDTLLTVNGCDSLITTNLLVGASITLSQSISLCNGDSVTVGINTYTASGNYTDILTAANGCDSTVFTALTVRPVAVYSQSLSLCSGNSVVVGSHTYNSNGTYFDTLVATNGCDSLVTTTINVLPVVLNSQTLVLCSGGNINVGIHTYSSTGIYHDTLQASNGCDSVITTNLTILPAITFSQNPVLCSGGNIQVGANTYSVSGTYTDTLIAENGCDSVVTTNLVVLSGIGSVQNIAICHGDSVQIGTHTYSASGVYSDTLVAVSGCDSVLTTNLLVNAPIVNTNAVVICSNDSVFAGGAWQHSSGTYYDTLVAATGCDSVIVTALSTIPQWQVNQSAAICHSDSAFLGGGWQHLPGVYYDTLTSASGCDSIIITTLAINMVDTSLTVSGDTLFSNADGTTWQWLDCTADTIITGATDSLFVPGVTGWYAVIINENSCSDTSACYYVLITGSTEPVYGDAFSLYPNPVSDVLTIKSSGVDGSEIRCVLYDLAGEIVINEEFSNTSIFTINVGSLAAGTYIVEITSGDHYWVSRIVKY